VLGVYMHTMHTRNGLWFPSDDGTLYTCSTASGGAMAGIVTASGAATALSPRSRMQLHEKAPGQEAKLCSLRPALMENSSGLVIAATKPTCTDRRKTAEEDDRAWLAGVRRLTLGRD
jgi:hypothetical protein